MKVEDKRKSQILSCLESYQCKNKYKVIVLHTLFFGWASYILPHNLDCMQLIMVSLPSVFVPFVSLVYVFGWLCYDQHICEWYCVSSGNSFLC